MNVLDDRQYLKTHEWVSTLEDGHVRIGISDHAQEAMGDLVFVDLPEVGDDFSAGDSVVVVESVKAVSDVYTPFSGRVFAINELLLDEPASVNENPYGAWLVELEDVGEGEVLSAQEYIALLEQEEA